MSDRLPFPVTDSAEPTRPIRVAVLTEVCLYRDGLARLLGGRSDVTVVAQSPDILLVDAATLRNRTIERDGARIVTFAVAEEDDEAVIACVEAGAVGFVARNATADDLLAVIHSAARGEVRCSPKIAALVFRRVATAARRWVRPDDASLTAREAQVLDLVDVGLSNKEIAGRLCIGTATVKSHVHNILEKLKFRRRAEAAAFVRAARRVRM